MIGSVRQHWPLADFLSRKVHEVHHELAITAAWIFRRILQVYRGSCLGLPDLPLASGQRPIR